MVVTLSGMVMLVKPLQLSNALAPILVKVLGKDMLVILLQLLKTLSPILVTPSGITKLVIFSPLIYNSFVRITGFEEPLPKSIAHHCSIVPK